MAGTLTVYVVLCAVVFVVAQAVNSETDDHCNWTDESDSSRCAASCHTFNVGDTPGYLYIPTLLKSCYWNFHNYATALKLKMTIYRASSPSGKHPTPVTRTPFTTGGRKPISIFLSAAVPWFPLCPKGQIILSIYTGPAASKIIKRSPVNSDHQQRTWYDVCKDFWISIAILVLFLLWYLLETGVIVCGIALVGSMIWNIASKIFSPFLLDVMGLFLLAMSPVLYWYITELLRTRGCMLEVTLSHSDKLAARMYLTFQIIIIIISVHGNVHM